MKKFYEKYLHNYGFLCVVAAIVLNFLIECFSRRSLIKGLKYMVDSPLVFLYNALIILLTLSIIFLIRRRVFLFSLISIVWLCFGIANGVVLSKRVTPFTAIELKFLDSVTDIMGKYLTGFQIGLIIVGIVALGIGLVLAFVFAPKYKGELRYKKNIPLFIVFVLFFTGVTKVAIKADVVTTYFGNIAYAYLDYGFPYCFSNTLINTGISKPTKYSEQAVKNVFENNSDAVEASTNSTGAVQVDTATVTPQASEVSTKATTKTPNIIFLQLESFFDPNRMKGLSFSEDPVPNFRKLEAEWPSGYLKVPAFGAGTCNTEFEVMTGMNLKFFGPGEYPYKTILEKKTVESTAYDLKPLGYATHAIHNNKGTFYSRNSVFKNLGYDDFTSIEAMNINEFTPKGWAKDKYLTQYIDDALNSTSGQDYIYTISVQGHGEYPEEAVAGHTKITVSGITATDTAKNLNAFEYYVNEIHEMDQFIAQLTDELSKRDEPTILVMYGDHLPSLGIQNSDMDNNDVYTTQYVIWNNFGMKMDDKNLTAYQLSSYVMGKVGISNGILTKYHQLYSDSANYEKNLKLLQYDMLYGKQYIYGGVNPFKTVDTKIGVKQVSISGVSEANGILTVKGQNFTQSSKLEVNGSTKDTKYIDANTLEVKDVSLKDQDKLIVGQFTVTDYAISKSEPYIYSATGQNN